MSHEFLDATSDIGAALREESAALYRLSEAFYTTGNPQMGDRLSWSAENLEVQRQRLSDCVGKKVNSDYRESMEATGSVLKAALAGVTLAARPKDDPA